MSLALQDKRVRTLMLYSGAVFMAVSYEFPIKGESCNCPYSLDFVTMSRQTAMILFPMGESGLAV